jgi:hypothetical protein
MMIYMILTHFPFGHLCAPEYEYQQSRNTTMISLPKFEHVRANVYAGRSSPDIDTIERYQHINTILGAVCDAVEAEYGIFDLPTFGRYNDILSALRNRPKFILGTADVDVYQLSSYKRRRSTYIAMHIILDWVEYYIMYCDTKHERSEMTAAERGKHNRMRDEYCEYVRAIRTCIITVTTQLRYRMRTTSVKYAENALFSKLWAIDCLYDLIPRSKHLFRHIGDAKLQKKIAASAPIQFAEIYKAIDFTDSDLSDDESDVDHDKATVTITNNDEE